MKLENWQAKPFNFSCFPLWGELSRRNGQMSPMKRGKCRKATKGARPPRRRRWQAKPSNFSCFPLWGEWILRAKRVKDERGLFFKNVANVHIGSVTNLYRLDFHFIPSSHFSSAVDAPSPSDFVCHLSRFIGRACPKGESKIYCKIYYLIKNES